MHRSKRRVALSHFAENLTIVTFPKSHRNFPRRQIKRNLLPPGLFPEHKGGSQGGMPGKRKLLLHCEDAYSGRGFDGIFTGKNKGGLRKIHLTSYSPHFRIAQTTSIREDGQRIAFQRPRGKNIHLHKIESPNGCGHWSPGQNWVELRQLSAPGILICEQGKPGIARHCAHLQYRADEVGCSATHGRAREWKRMGSGDSPGLQNRRKAGLPRLRWVRLPLASANSCYRHV